MKNPETPIHITVPQHAYDDFNQSVAGTLGITFEQLVVNRPIDAYWVLTTVIESNLENISHINTPEGVWASRDLDGTAAVAGLARTALRDTGSDPEFVPVDVEIIVTQKPSLADRILGRQPASKQAIAFRIEPPDLAF